MNKLNIFLLNFVVYLLTFVMAIVWNDVNWNYRILFNVMILAIVFLFSSYLAKCNQQEQRGLNSLALRYFKRKVISLDGVKDIYSDHYDSADFVTVTMVKRNDEVKKVIEAISKDINKKVKCIFEIGFKYRKVNNG